MNIGPSQGEIMPKYMEPRFFYIYKVFWSFLHDFNLLNPNPLSVRRKSLSNFVDAKNQDGRQKREAVQESVSVHVSYPHRKLHIWHQLQ